MSYAEVVGLVPDEHRNTLVRPIDLDGDKCERRDDGVVGIHRFYESVASLGDPDPSLGHMAVEYAALFAAVAKIGDLAFHEHDKRLVWVHLLQGPSMAIPGERTWHNDHWGPTYRRLIASNVYGPVYDHPDGTVHGTPDFGILKVDNAAMHCAQLGFNTETRTRLQIEIF
jgi:hypothetical protein